MTHETRETYEFNLSIDKVLFDEMVEQMREYEGLEEEETRNVNDMMERMFYYAVGDVLGPDQVYDAYERGMFVARYERKSEYTA